MPNRSTAAVRSAKCKVLYILGSSLFTVGKTQPSGGAGLAFTALRAASGKEKGPEAMGALPAV